MIETNVESATYGKIEIWGIVNKLTEGEAQ